MNKEIEKVEEYLQQTEDEINDVAKKEFKIKDVGTANWAIEKCTKQNESFEFYKKSVKSEIERLNTELKEEERRTKDRNSYLLYLVEQYINEQNIPTKDTKTQKSVKFATGKFIVKNPTIEVIPRDDFETLKTYEPFINYLKECEDFELLKTKTEVKWGEIKKDITFDEDGNVIRESTGEVLDFLTTKTSPKELKVK